MLAFNSAELLLLLIVVQQGIAAPLWALTGHWRVAPRVPSLHWAGAAGIAALALAMPLLSPGMQGHVLANLVAPGIFLLTRLGLQILFRSPRCDHEHLAVVVLSVVGTLAGQWFNAPGYWFVALSSALNAFSLLRAVQVVGPAARHEVGTGPARLVLVPLGFVGLLFAVRAVGAFWVPDEIGVPLEQVTSTNVALLAGMMTFGLLVHLALGLAIALRLVSKMRRLSRLDELTQLPNRRAADELLASLYERGQQQERASTLLAVDVDHFKRINDQHGHLAGDRALVHLARLLGQQLRVGDMLARIGGEELLVLLPDTSAHDAAELAERLRLAISTVPLRWGPAEITMTVSVGVAELGPEDSSPSAWLDRADARLYQAKREGRNRVVS